MSGEPYGAAVVGAGVEGLVAALRLARAGHRTVVLEGRSEAGGLAAPRRFHPGYRVPGALHDQGLFRPAIGRELELAKHGLSIEPSPPVLVAESDGPGFALRSDAERTAAELAGRSAADAAGYLAWSSWLGRVRPALRTLLDRPPPLVPGSAEGLLAFARGALALRRLGAAEMREVLRVLPMSAADRLRESVGDELLAEALVAPALVGSFLGPRAGGTAALVVLRQAAVSGVVAGGPPALVAALLAAAAEAGVEVRTGTEVERIALDGKGAAVGVEVAGGEGVAAGAVVAACDPKRALLGLLPPGALPVGTESRIAAFRARGTAAKVHLALSGRLELAARPGERFHALGIGCGGLDALERAYDAAKYRRLPERLHLDVRVPTVADEGLAPAGCDLVSILATAPPRDLDGGWDDAARQRLGDLAVARLAEHAPTLPGRIVAREVLTPADLEAEYGLTGGHLHGGELALDQLFLLRPTPDTARYATPVPGLYLAGSGSHPGGGMSGMAGWLGAGRVLEDRRGR